MFKVDDEEKGAKSKVLQEIMGMMDGHIGDKLKGLKGPKAVEVSAVEAKPMDEEGIEHEAMETPEEEIAEHAAGGEESDEEPSDEDKNMIRELYTRWCR